MKIFLLLLVGFFVLTAQAATPAFYGSAVAATEGQARTLLVSESMADPAGDGAARETEAAASPWQGTWVGNENSSSGMNLPVKAKIKVTGDTISGSWNVQAGGLNPITGTINGEEASITILQGGGMIKATLVNETTFKYSGIQGYGTLTKQEKSE